MSNYFNDKELTSQHFEKLESVDKIDENQSNSTVSFNKCINSQNTNHYKLPSSAYPISIDDKQKYLLLKNIMQLYDDPNELSINPNEWLRTDSISGRVRAPRQDEFLYLLLEKPRYSSYISWLNKNEGVFKIHEPERIVLLWSKIKSRPAYGTMNYESFARGIRYHYKSGSMIKTHKKYTFRFKLPVNSKE